MTAMPSSARDVSCRSPTCESASAAVWSAGPAADRRVATGTPAHAPVSLRDVEVRLGGTTLLAGITVELTEPRIAIVGRNGSGKSTLLRVIAGLLEASSGAVLVDGRDPFSDREAMIRQIGILFQNPDHQILFPTVAQELAFGLRQQGVSAGEAATRVLGFLEREGRRDWLQRPTHLLSQGQRQYLCLAAVLLMEPATILLDEPFSGLDLPTRSWLKRRLSALDQQTIIVTHDVDDIGGCDRVLWIEAGRIVADGAPTSVLGPYLARMAELGEADVCADVAG